MTDDADNDGLSNVSASAPRATNDSNGWTSTDLLGTGVERTGLALRGKRRCPTIVAKIITDLTRYRPIVLELI